MIEPLVEAHEGFNSAFLDIVVLLSAGLPLIPVACNCLAVIDESARIITRSSGIVTWPSNIAIISVLFGSVVVIVDL